MIFFSFTFLLFLIPENQWFPEWSWGNRTPA